MYLYNSDSSLRKRLDQQSMIDRIKELWRVIVSKHQFWYKDSQLEDAVEDIKQDGSRAIQQASETIQDVVEDLKEEATEIVQTAKVKLQTKKQSSSSEPSKVKKDNPTNKKSSSKKQATKKSK